MGVLATRFGQQMMGNDGGTDGLDNDDLVAGAVNIGATIMGRNMFGPVRGPGGDSAWSGWWGDEPPHHHPVFVSTHHPRPPLTMQGGTTFHFTDEPVDVVAEQAFAAADGADVRGSGGASTVQQYLRAGLVDEMHVANRSRPARQRRASLRPDRRLRRSGTGQLRVRRAAEL